MKDLFGYIDSFIANSGSIRISFAEGMWPKGSITESMVSPAGFIYWLVGNTRKLDSNICQSEMIKFTITNTKTRIFDNNKPNKNN